jgi:hypothetical protein
VKARWLVGGLAVGAAYAWRKLRSPYAEPEPQPAPVVGEGADPRAEELKRKLEESRPLVDERDAFEEGETPVDAADPDDRRRSVHERGRSTIDEMRDEMRGD